VDWVRVEGLPRQREDLGVHLGSGRTASSSGGSVKQGRFPRQNNKFITGVNFLKKKLSTLFVLFTQIREFNPLDEIKKWT